MTVVFVLKLTKQAFVFMTGWNKQTNWPYTVSHRYSLFMFGGPCHLSSFKQCSEDFIVLREQLVYSVVEKKQTFCLCHYLINIVIQTEISSPKLHSAPLRKILWNVKLNGYPVWSSTNTKEKREMDSHRFTKKIIFHQHVSVALEVDFKDDFIALSKYSTWRISPTAMPTLQKQSLGNFSPIDTGYDLFDTELSIMPLRWAQRWFNQTKRLFGFFSADPVWKAY